MRNLFKKYQEIIAYLFWGVMTTVVSWVSYSLFVLMLKVALSSQQTIFTANILSWCCAVCFAFFTNKKWVFHSESRGWKEVFPEFVRFVSARLITFAVEAVGVPLCVYIGIDGTVFGIDGMVAKVLVSVVVTILNYIFSKLLVFKTKREEVQ